jgi:MFS family permease
MINSYIQSFRGLGRNAKLYLISNTIQALTAGTVGVLYLLYLAELGYSGRFLGLVLFAGVIGAAIAIPPASPLVHRFGWRAMLLWADWVGGVAIFLQFVLPIGPLIVLTSVAAGASFAIVLIVNTPLLTAYSPPESRTAVFGLGSALGLLAAILGSLLGGWPPVWFASSAIVHSTPLTLLSPLLVPGAKAQSYELALLVAGALAVPSIIPIYMMSDDRRERAPTAAPTAAPIAAPLAKPLPLGERVRAWLRLARAFTAGVVGRFSMTQALLGFGAGLFVPYIGLYFVRHLHTSTAYYGVIAALLMVLQAITALLSAPLARRFGEVRGSVLAQVVSLPFLLGMAFAPGLALISFAFLVRGALISMAGPPLQTFLMGAVSEERRVVASEAFNVTWQIAGALGIVAGGVLLDRAGYPSTSSFLVAAVCYGLSALLLMLWFGWRERPGQQVAAVRTTTEETAFSAGER